VDDGDIEFVGFSDGYFEIGYGTTVSEIDLGVALIFSGEDLSDEEDADGNSDDSTAVVLSIGKSF
jgi:hypothetical protein